MSKIKKLPDGEARGSRTFGEICKPKSGASKPCTLNLRDQAADKIVRLMTLEVKDRKYYVNKRQEEYLSFQNKFAENPSLVQFAYWRTVLNELRDELNKLEEGGNKIKIDTYSPVIKKQMEEVEIKMRELFDDIKNERK